jgi:hypothetical protein
MFRGNTLRHFAEAGEFALKISMMGALNMISEFGEAHRGGINFGWARKQKSAC